MKTKLINILIDFAFKKVFAGEGKKSELILIDFLNSILDLTDDKKIKEITYLNPFNDRTRENDKQSIMDIKVKTELEERIDIEVQINDVDNYKKRSLYYWSKLYAETIEKGESYEELKKSIVINIVDFNLLKDSNKYHSVFQIKEREDSSLFIEDLELHYIELTKFNTDKSIEDLNDLEEWITFLKDCGNKDKIEDIEKLSHKKEEIAVASQIIKTLSSDEREYQEYLSREKYWHDEMSKKAYAKRREEETKRREEETKRREEETKRREEETKRREEEIKSREEEIKRQQEEIKIREEQLNKELEEVSNKTLDIACSLISRLDDTAIATITKLELEQVIKLRKNSKDN